MPCPALSNEAGAGLAVLDMPGAGGVKATLPPAVALVSDPAAGVPEAVALKAIGPPTSPACTVYVLEQVVLAPGARGPAPQVMVPVLVPETEKVLMATLPVF